MSEESERRLIQNDKDAYNIVRNPKTRLILRLIPQVAVTMKLDDGCIVYYPNNTKCNWSIYQNVICHKGNFLSKKSSNLPKVNRNG